MPASPYFILAQVGLVAVSAVAMKVGWTNQNPLTKITKSSAIKPVKPAAATQPSAAPAIAKPTAAPASIPAAEVPRAIPFNPAASTASASALATPAAVISRDFGSRVLPDADAAPARVPVETRAAETPPAPAPAVVPATAAIAEAPAGPDASLFVAAAAASPAPADLPPPAAATNIAPPSDLPPELPLSDLASDMAAYRIEADAATNMDLNTQIVVFNGGVKLESKRFALSADKLTVHMNPGQSTLKKLVATGHVQVALHATKPEEAYQGRAHEATYNPQDTSIALTGWPVIHGHGRDHRATSPSTKMLLFTDKPKLLTEGRASTQITGKSAAEAAKSDREMKR